ncbi:MAG: MBL fold metallo-hydrolase [Bacilli bacterium]|nr:MBL fold metallo-hydrolase [Bacilli bacterium]
MIKVNCQSSICILESKTIYFDPIKLNDKKDADYIFITHPHWDHFSKEDILKIKRDSTKLIGPKGIEKEALELGFSQEDIILLDPNCHITLENIEIDTVPAYNINKDFHKKDSNWLGYIVKLDSITYYIPGDTDVIVEMDDIHNIDVLFIPIGGVYTMNAIESSEITNRIKPKKVIPIHYGMAVGTRDDFITFKNHVIKDIEVEELIEMMKK